MPLNKWCASKHMQSIAIASWDLHTICDKQHTDDIMNSKCVDPRLERGLLENMKLLHRHSCNWWWMGGQGLTMVIVAEASHFETEECIAAREEWANSSDLELVFVDSLQVVTHWSGDNWDGGIGSGLVSNWGGELRDSVCDCLDAFRKSHALFNLPTPNTSEKERREKCMRESFYM